MNKKIYLDEIISVIDLFASFVGSVGKKKTHKCLWKKKEAKTNVLDPSTVELSFVHPWKFTEDPLCWS